MLALQSQVVAGHVGLGAAAPALSASGVEVWGLPTVTLSGHAAMPGVQGRRATAEEIRALGALGRGLAASGRLGRLSGVLTGYLGAAEAAEAAAEVVETALEAAPQALYLCDPVLGDDGRLYLPEAVGETLRRRLLPRAALATPNMFELGWLTERPVETLAEAREAAQALRALGPRTVFATSASPRPGRIGVLAVWEGGAAIAHGPEAPRRVNGAGDFLAARLLAETLAGRDPAEAAARAVGAASALAAQAEAEDRDDLPVAAFDWSAARPATVEPL
ncbi:MAG: pyridoxal kinase [Pseudomonadota bacterium]